MLTDCNNAEQSEHSDESCKGDQTQCDYAPIITADAHFHHALPNTQEGVKGRCVRNFVYHYPTIRLVYSDDSG